jgi:V/A-type H+-transporting ATPase subunit I
LMKKFTIITPPEYEHQIIGELGAARVVQLKAVSGMDVERLRKTGERIVDFKGLYEKFRDEYKVLEESNILKLEGLDLEANELSEFTEDPAASVDDFLAKFRDVQEKIREVDARREEGEKKLIDTKLRLESLKALEPEELKKCLIVGLADLSIQQRLNEYLQRFEDLSSKIVEFSSEKGYVFVFGPEERREWVETIFLIFEVKNIFEVLNTQDILLAIDDGRREEVIKEYEQEVQELQILTEAEAEYEQIKAEYSPVLGNAMILDQMLRILSDESVPSLRTNVISVVQGWIHEDNITTLDTIIGDLQKKTGELFYLEYENPGHDDHNIPNPEPKMPKILQPTWTLTKLRGWPSVMEVNPSYITVLIFSFQFGLMYGDIGQGLIFLILGFYLSRKSTRGLSYRVGGLMVPMGISAIFFGFAYDSVFLIEHGISHWLHDAHISLPFQYPIMPNPVLETTKLMLLVFQIAMLEIVFGLVIGAYNQIKAGNPVGAIGEHGLGMILYVVGLYQTAMYFISIGMDFMAAMGSPWFLVCIAGMLLSFLEPVIHSVQHGHGVGMEAIGEGVGGLLMTFVEGLANMFSYLRIAAFALAHASLAIAAEALTHSLGIAGIGLIVMNVIALSFEMISSSVQSLRLLYYEFMGKFYQGDGVPFKPFRLRARATGN